VISFAGTPKKGNAPPGLKMHAHNVRPHKTNNGRAYAPEKNASENLL
jgi:hypothetical protein